MHHEPFDEGVDHAHQVFGWHRQFAAIELIEPLGAEVIAALGDLVHARA